MGNTVDNGNGISEFGVERVMTHDSEPNSAHSPHKGFRTSDKRNHSFLTDKDIDNFLENIEDDFDDEIDDALELMLKNSDSNHRKKNNDNNNNDKNENDKNILYTKNDELKKKIDKFRLQNNNSNRNLNGKNFHYVSAQNIIPDISQKFVYLKQLGIGASCRVLLVKPTRDDDDDDDVLYALKELSTADKYNPMLFKKEIRLLSNLSHPNILKYHSSYLDNKNFYIATQYCSGGDLLERCKQFDHFSERVASQMIHTVLDAINHMHSKGVVHRDLKPGNIVFDKPWPEGKLCIIDLGDSETVVDNEIYTEFVGTLHYLPPEVTRYRHGWELKKGDIWSIGVLTYVLLCGKPPFDGANNKTVIKKIQRGTYGYPRNVLLSKSAKEFIKKCLLINVHSRCTAEKALKHKWFDDATDDHLGKDIVDHLADYGDANKLQQILINSIISELSPKEKNILLKAFQDIDLDHNGYIELNEIEHYLISLKIKKHDAHNKAKQIMNAMDKNGTGKVSFREFMQSRTFSKMKSVKRMKSVDDDDDGKHDDHDDDAIIDGYISVEELKNSLKQNDDDDDKIDIDKIIEKLDENNTGYIEKAKLIDFDINL